MADIRDITIGNQYQGNPVLGGGYYQGVTIDTTALQRLATFTYYRDRDLWMKKQADDKAAAAQIADLTAYDIRSPMKGYTDYLLNKKQEAKDFIEKNPNALYFDRDKSGYQKLHEIIGDFNTARAAANLSDVIYTARKTTIDKLPEGADKTAAQLGLDMDVKNLFSNGIDGALNNTLASAEELNPDTYTIPKLADTQRVFVVNDKNGTEISKVKFADIDNLDAQADAAWFGLKKPLDITSHQFQQLSDDEKQLRIAQDKVISAQRLGIERTTGLVNSLLGQIKAANPDVKIETVSTDNLPDSLKETIESVKAYNAQVDKLNLLTGQKYKHLNLDDGLSGQEVIKLNAFQQNKNTLYSEEETKVQESEAHRMEIERGKLAVERGKLNLDESKFKLEETKFNTATTGTDQGKSAAVAFADKLFSDLTSAGSVKITLPNGTGGVLLTPTDVRKLTQDQLKYLGVETPPVRDATTGIVTESGGLNPLTLGPTDLIQVESDGTVRVMKDAKYNQKLDRWTGQWDNTKSTSVWNAARNVLNEENVKSGTKERNAYVPIDMIGNEKGVINVDNSGGSTKTTVTEKTKTSTYTAQMPDGRIITSTDGTTWYYSDGKKVQ